LFARGTDGGGAGLLGHRDLNYAMKNDVPDQE
jgi:hypothetical protein